MSSLCRPELVQERTAAPAAPPAAAPIGEAGLGGTALDRFAVVDVETSGLSAKRHRILQIAVVTVDGRGVVTDRWDTLVRPRLGRVGPTHIHGLTARELRRAPTFADVAPELVVRLDGAVFTAHNAEFDWGFVSAALRRSGYAAPDVARLCTMRLSRAVTEAPDVTSHRLVDVCARHGIAITRAHDARADAEATATVLPLLLADGGLTSSSDLAPHLIGASDPWPAWSPPPWWRRLLYR
jgi:DNA polymerase III subunit epsilon